MNFRSFECKLGVDSSPSVLGLVGLVFAIISLVVIWRLSGAVLATEALRAPQLFFPFVMCLFSSGLAGGLFLLNRFVVLGHHEGSALFVSSLIAAVPFFFDLTLLGSTVWLFFAVLVAALVLYLAFLAVSVQK